jgi:ankyrin repeat protein
VLQRARGPQASLLNTHFLDAIRNGQLDTMQALFAQGADINSQDDMGNPSLLVAARHRQAAAARKLLDLGADPTLTNREGMTALQLAQRLGFPDIVRVLQEPR